MIDIFGLMPVFDSLRGIELFWLMCARRDVAAKTAWPRGYKTYFILNSAELEIFSANKYENANNRCKRYLQLLVIWDLLLGQKKVREKSRECHNHKPQLFPDPKRKRKPTNLNKHKPNKRTKSTKISSLFPKRGNRNTKRTEKHKNKMTHGKTYNKSPRRINHKATRSKTNTWTTALEQSVEQTTGEFKALLQLANFTLGPDATLNT